MKYVCAFITSLSLLAPGAVRAQIFDLIAMADGGQEVPPVAGSGCAHAIVVLDSTTNELSWDIRWAGLSGAATGMHFHVGSPGVNGGIVVNVGGISGLTSPSIGSAIITNPQELEVLSGNWYLNIHTAANPAGEVRGQLTTTIPPVVGFDASMSGSNEVPAVGGSGTGSASVSLDQATNLLSWNVTWSDLSGAATGMHFHQAPAGSNGPIVLNIGSISGLTSPSVGSDTVDCTGISALLSDGWYINIHTAANPGGEIRGQAVLSGVLPVELERFDAIINGDEAYLSWSTASETNNAGFEVQHADGFPEESVSRSNLSWTVADFVEGRGNSVERVDYSYVVRDLVPGVHLFRLKQIDLDGAFSYSEVVEAYVELPSGITLSNPYPNPFQSTSRVRFIAASTQHVVVTLYNAAGQEVELLFEGSVEAGVVQNIEIDGRRLSSGAYRVLVEGDSFSGGRTIILSR